MKSQQLLIGMRIAFFFSLLFFLVPSIWGQDDDQWVPEAFEHRFHPDEGVPWFMKDSRPDSLDILHYDIRLDRPDREKMRLEGTCRVEAEVLQEGLEAFPFDLAGFEVVRAMRDGEELSYRREGQKLIVDLGGALSKGERIELSFHYQGEPEIDPSGWGGTYFRKGYVFNLGVGFKAKPHSYARTWFPAVDHFRERATYSFRVVAPEDEKAICSGTLDEVRKVEEGREWVWHLEKEIPPYLVSFAIGDFVSIQRDYESISGRTIPIRLDVPPEDSANAIGSFDHLEEALAAYEERFGPYRWPRVGYVAVPFPNGAMEHATNIAYPQASVNGTQRSDDLMAHELAHAWWGNLVTCATPWDMWVNEGMASFSEFLFYEGLEGKAAYWEAVKKNHKKVLRKAHLKDGDRYRSVYGIPHAYTYGAHVYDKGADVMRTFRYMLGDEDFFPPLKRILKENAYDNIATHQFWKEWERHGDGSIEAYFKDWLLRPGFPHFRIRSYSTKKRGDAYSVSSYLEQRSTHASEPYRAVPMNLYFRGADGEEAVRRAISSREVGIHREELGFEPVHVSADPGGRLAQATLTDTATLENKGVHAFDHTDAKVELGEGMDPFYIQLRQHFIDADIQASELEKEFRYSKARYWSLGGTFDRDSSLRIVFEVDGRQRKGAHPEIRFFDGFGTIDEEKLFVLHRPPNAEEWRTCSSCEVLSRGSASDGHARLLIKNGLKGDFVLAAPVADSDSR